MKPAAMEAHDTNYVGGDINGGVADLRQLFARPVSRCIRRRRRSRGLYLCSSSTPPGGGIHGMCGWHAAKLVCAAGLIPVGDGQANTLAPLKDAAADARAVAGLAVDVEDAADRAEPVGHVHEPVPGPRRGRVEAGAVVGHLEAELRLRSALTVTVSRGLRRRACPRSAWPRGSRSRPPSRRLGVVAADVVGIDRRCGSMARLAAVRSASGRPRSRSSGG